MWLVIALHLLLGSCIAQSKTTEKMQFQADRYDRDLETNTTKGRGHAWLKRGEQEIWADSIELDDNTHRAIAVGHVHIREGDLHMWATRLDYQMNGEDAVLDDGIILTGQMVMTGVTIHRIARGQYEVDQGSYTNCNLTPDRTAKVESCPFDWKFYGKHFSIVNEGYAQITDAVVFAKGVPVLYSPYLIYPVKSLRQSGFLMPAFLVDGELGTGTSLPLFWDMGPWQDMTINTTVWNHTGVVIDDEYRYIYDSGRRGNASVYLIQRHFGGPDPSVSDTNAGDRYLGLVGEAAINAENVYRIGDSRSQARLNLRLLTDPYVTHNYPIFGGLSETAGLRSLAALTTPGDHYLFTGSVEKYENLIISKDTTGANYGAPAIDHDAPMQLPHLTLSRSTTPLIDRYLSLEFDSNFNNYWRYQDYDGTALNQIYLRTGRRLQLEPRVILTVPMPDGLYLQPLVRGGTLTYQFDTPRTEIFNHEYAEVEIPFSLYLSKTFDTSISGFEKIAHVLQPRIIYDSSLYSSPEPENLNDYPFFRPGSPRFDIVDQFVKHQYLRFELINRFIRKTGPSARDRFFLLQVSEQYNTLTSPLDPRYATHIGPLEVLADFHWGQFSFNVQGISQLSREGIDQVQNPTLAISDWAASVGYSAPNTDGAHIGTHLLQTADPNYNQKSITLDFYKTLPLFFSLSGAAEFSFITKNILDYQIGFHFQSKPQACWEFSFITGMDAYRNPMASIRFNMYFGHPNAALKGF